MNAPQAPRIDPRRRKDFSLELQERARAWIPGWAFADVERDFGRALLEIAARFNSEVAERLDNAGEKMRRGFLDWLGVRGQAARPARMPVVLKLADNAPEGVLASAPVRLQGDADDTPVIFETETDVFVAPGKLDVLVGVDAGADAFYLPPPGLNDLAPLEALPTQWQLKSFAASGATTLQLDPDAGLEVEIIIEAGGKQYLITKVDNGIVTIEPSLQTGLPEKTIVRKVVTFAPFDGITRNRQEHTLYIGDDELLNIESAATIEVVGAESLRTGFTWQYWGKVKDGEESGWQALTLAETQEPDALVLVKAEGAVDLKKIGEINSRWIRGTTSNIADATYTFTVDALKIRVNGAKRTCEQLGAVEGPASEAMVNNTPLVLSEPFYPLGRVPRQFDAFYLGNAEAFAKKGAVAQICFDLSDATCLTYTPVPAGSFANEGVLAGVGKDNALHLLKLNPADGKMTAFRGPLRPPLPTTTTPPPAQKTPIDLNPLCRPVIWNVADDFFVAVASRASIWIWHEDKADSKKSGWDTPIDLPDLPGKPADIQDIIVFGSSLTRPGAVLSNGRLWKYDGTNWSEPLDDSAQPQRLRDYASIAPIYNENLILTDGLVAIGANGKLYRIDGAINVKEELVGGDLVFDVGSPPKAGEIPVGGIRPAAYDTAGKVRVVAVDSTRKELVAIEKGSLAQKEPLNDAEVTGGAVTLTKISADFQFTVSLRKASDKSAIAVWSPDFATADARAIFETTIPGATGDLGSPLLLGSYVAVPGSHGDAFVAPYNPNGRLTFSKIIREGVLLPMVSPSVLPFKANEFVSALSDTGVRKEWKITKRPLLRDTNDVLYIVEDAFGAPLKDDPEFIGYKGAGLPGTVDTNHKFHIAAINPDLTDGLLLRVQRGNHVRFCEVDRVVGTVVVVTTNLPPGTSDQFSYWIPVPFAATVLPAIEFGPAEATATLVETTKFYFPSPVSPSPQRATAYGLVGPQATAAVLGEKWSTAPLSSPTSFIIDAALGTWRRQLADTRSNPALSWEYWNGKGWWSLEITEDGTARLASSGPVKFKVPQDIAESDWAGKTNFWIRARLVGGDYGEEEVKVVTQVNQITGLTEQVVVRSTENIKAPQILEIKVSYAISEELLPTYVLAQDSGSIVDQSDANRTGGALVEAFIPIAQALGRLSTAVGKAEATADCPPDCECAGSEPTNTSAPAVSRASLQAPTTPATGRSLFIGLNATLSGGPVNVLLLVDRENDHRAFAPMTIEALSPERHFKPIVAEDTTRALGESGVLSMSFAVSPTLSDLFGATRTWLRLNPRSADGEWTPSVRGAYLNAVYASAKETLTREPVGSADGSPNLKLHLARPPVLRNTLELRVREPLGEEEREALVARDANCVLTDPDGLTGEWVLWKEVLDPDDAGPSDRVYALDDETGEIRFGDGLRGRIPPIGRDAIVAFGYSRTEGSRPGSETVPANSIKPRTPLNLVTPVESVESVIAADQAAGGAPPETDERVLRFGFARLRHRDRAVTAKDIEDLAMQSSPDIAQAKVVVKPGSVRLVIVMKGKDPTPNAAQKREFRRTLLNVSPISLSSTGAFQIIGPGIRKLRVELVLDIPRLDYAGQVSKWVKAKLLWFFDSTIGGVDCGGWILGSAPTEDDIALVLINAPNVDGIRDMKLYENMGDGVERPFPASVRPTDLVVLDDDPIRIQFQTAEVTV